MKTLYAACLSRLGLSQSEAAALHGVGLQSVKNWCAGRSAVPDGLWADLRGYEQRIVDRSEALREAWEDAGEVRDVDVKVNGDPTNLMAAADFLLSTDADLPVSVRVID